MGRVRVLILLFWCLAGLACQNPATPAQRARRSLHFNAIGAGLVSAYGLTFWDWGTHSFSTGDEGWLQSDTRHGGADKFGHAYSAAVISGLSSHLYASWGYEPERAALYGAGTSLALTTLVEVGDGFSREFGFSFEDLAFNGLGIGFEYARRVWPAFGERVQFRWQWLPSRAFRAGDIDDATTDYSGSYYLLAFPLAPWVHEAHGPLRFLELQLGFGTRGYAESAPYFDTAEQRTFVGIGINATELIHHFTGTRARRVFDYLQVPGLAAHSNL